MAKKITNTEKQAIEDPMLVFASMLGGSSRAIERSEAQKDSKNW